MKPIKLKVNWAVVGLLAMILFIVAVAWAQVQSTTLADPAAVSKECTACHAMQERATALVQTSHKDAACTACHADTGLMGWLGIQYAKQQMAGIDETGNGAAHISDSIAHVSNERCIECHSREMPWVMQDLEPPKLDEKGEPIRVARDQLEFLPGQAGHDVHLRGEDSLNCTDCHFDVAHGPADQTPKQVANMHEACLNCHAEQKVAVTVRNAVSCSACHVDLERVTPPDHQATTFREEHGKSALSSIATCQQCHLNPGIGTKVASSSQGLQTVANTTLSTGKAPSEAYEIKFPPGSLAVPPGMQDACASCHGTTMPHPTDWLKQHTTGYQEKPELCASCHGTSQNGFNMQVVGNPRTLSTTDPTCTGCHAQPMPHPDTWLADHPEAAGKAPKTCEQCHSSSNPANPTAVHATPKFCLDCHSGSYNHPNNWIANHASAVNAKGGSQWAAGCTQCHTETVNSCTSCHTDGVGKKQQWHPSDWIANHAAPVQAVGYSQAAAGCTECHTQTFNSCTSCHAGGVQKQQQWHPQDFVGTHKDTVAQFDDDPAAANCTTCHTTTFNTFNSCTTCHTDGLDKTQQWHPNFWWVSHARTTNDSNKATCASCHDYVQPSCTECHTGDD